VGVGCNATCGPDFRLEGAAIVRAEASCKAKLAVDARVYYFVLGESVTGVADLKVIKLPMGNKGE
jgi:hypothetical protein